MRKVSSGGVKAEIPAFILAECIYVMEKFYMIPRNEISDRMKKIFNFDGIINSDRSQLINALIKYEETNIDISDCILASISSNAKIVLSFDKDMYKLNAVSEEP